MTVDQEVRTEQKLKQDLNRYYGGKPSIDLLAALYSKLYLIETCLFYLVIHSRLGLPIPINNEDKECPTDMFTVQSDL